MPFTSGTSSGGRIKDAADRVKVIIFRAPSNNKDIVTIGPKGVTVTDGMPIDPGDSFTVQFDPDESEPLSDFYGAVSGNDKIGWFVIFKDK